MSTHTPTQAVEVDVAALLEFIRTLGKDDGNGNISVTFSTLFKDDKLQNTLESLAGTLKTAKKRGLITYKAELLLQGVTDNEVITLKKQ